MTIGELIEQLGGKLAHGRSKTEITGVNGHERVTTTELVFAEDAAAAAEALKSPAGAVVLKAGLAPSYAGNPDIAVVESEQPRLWFARAAKLLKPELKCEQIHETAVIGEGAMLLGWVTVGPHAVIGKDALIGERTRIDAGAVIGEGVRILDDCHIYPRVVIYPGTFIGNRVVIHAGCVLGADGFGYVRDAETGRTRSSRSRATLAIEDDVEIGANSHRRSRGAGRDAHRARDEVRQPGARGAQLRHRRGRGDRGADRNFGSSTVGDGAVIAGQVGIGDHAHVGPGVILGGQAGVFSGATVTNEGLKPGTVLGHAGSSAEAGAEGAGGVGKAREKAGT